MSLFMMSTFWLLIFALAAPAMADDERFCHLTNLPVDWRFTTVHDLDHPVTFTPAFSSRTEWEQRAAQLRRQVQVAEGLWPMPARPPIKPVIWGRIERDGYTIEKVYFASRAGHYVTGNLYRPLGKRGPFPAVLAPHGHWENGRLMQRKPEQVQQELDSRAETTREAATYPLQARNAMLARMGCIVFQYDMVGIADSAPIAHREGFRDAEAELRLQSAMGLQTWNSLRAMDFLCALPDVDPKRVAVTGESGGGTQTLIVSALDDRLVAAVPAVMVSGNMQGGCVCENASLLRIDTNNIELSALFAPKPLGVIGANDWTIDIETRGYPELQRVYSLYDAAPNVFARHFPFPHNINQISREFTYNWLNKHLNLGLPEPIREQPFIPVPPVELSVYDPAHPRPADAVDAPTLRNQIARESDEQMATLAKTPDAFREVVRAALEVMVHDQLPTSVVVVPGSERTLAGNGFTVHQRVLTRPAEGDAVPTVEVSPTNATTPRIVLWTHPIGAESLFEADGRSPIPPVQKLLNAGTTVLAVDVLMTGNSRPLENVKPTTIPNESNFAGFRYGYNRSLIADRAHDLLTAIAYAKSRSFTSVDLIASERAGVWALLARAFANKNIDRASLDLDSFEFTIVQKASDEMFLPGALKYGGVLGFASLCTHGHTALFHALEKPACPFAPLPESVTVFKKTDHPQDLVDWILRDEVSSLQPVRED